MGIEAIQIQPRLAAGCDGMNMPKQNRTYRSKILWVCNPITSFNLIAHTIYCHDAPHVDIDLQLTLFRIIQGVTL